MNSSKFRQMEDEMSRFEAEISGGHALMNAVSFANGFASLPGFGNIPPPPAPPILIPHQVKHHHHNNKRPPNHHQQNHHHHNFQNFTHHQAATIVTQPAVVTAKPTLYPQVAAAAAAAAAKTVPVVAPAPIVVQQQPPPQSTVDFVTLQSEVEKKLKKLKNEKVSAELAISQGKASSALQSFAPDEFRRKGAKNRKLMRTAGGQTWEDHTLTDWPDDDFRIFAGDLGNDVTDELLIRTFNKYPSFQRAKVIRDKRTNKSKGYGFVSFKDPADFTKAMKEMNGRYVGSRPIKLRKSTWRNRCIDVVKKKEKEKAALISMLTSSGSGR